MAKKPQQQLQPGTKISGRKASAETYKKLFDFLLFDPLYRQMSSQARVLYSFLRDKVSEFEKKQEAFEEGIGTKSYLDEEGNIFVLADNVELEYILNASEPTVIKVKEELSLYGLLHEEPVKNKANRIYPLEPAQLSDRWQWIEEVKKLREQRKAENKAKAEKAKAKRAAKKKAAKENEKCNLKNLSHGNLKNLSHGNLKNLSKSQSNVFKYQSNISKTEISQSIERLDVSEMTKHHISKNPDRLTDDILKVIEEQYILNTLPETVFNKTLVKCLKGFKEDFEPYFIKSLQNAANEHETPKQPNEQTATPKRVEKLPDWFHEEEQSKEAASDHGIEDPDAKREELAEKIKRRRAKRAQDKPIDER